MLLFDAQVLTNPFFRMRFLVFIRIFVKQSEGASLMGNASIAQSLFSRKKLPARRLGSYLY